MIPYLFRGLTTTAAAIAAVAYGCQVIGALFSTPFAITYSVAWSLLVALLWAAIARPRSTP